MKNNNRGLIYVLSIETDKARVMYIKSKERNIEDLEHYIYGSPKENQ